MFVFCFMIHNMGKHSNVKIYTILPLNIKLLLTAENYLVKIWRMSLSSYMLLNMQNVAYTFFLNQTIKQT